MQCQYIIPLCWPFNFIFPTDGYLRSEWGDNWHTHTDHILFCMAFSIFAASAAGAATTAEAAADATVLLLKLLKLVKLLYTICRVPGFEPEIL